MIKRSKKLYLCCIKISENQINAYVYRKKVYHYNQFMAKIIVIFNTKDFFGIISNQ
jgi:hypothetical protein